MESTVTRIPPSVIRRLPRYLGEVRRLQREGRHWVSSAGLADSLGLTSSTVRQDLSHLDFQGMSKRGYSILGLEKALVQTLGTDRELTCVMVGAGNMARALLMDQEFPRMGFNIVAVFDNHPAVVGKKAGGLVVRPMDELPDVVAAHSAEIGILSVPYFAAQEVADRLVEAGAPGLLNLTEAHLRVPDDVAVVDARILVSLQELAYAVRSREAAASMQSDKAGEEDAGGGTITDGPEGNG